MPGVQRPERETDLSTPSGVEVRNALARTSTPSTYYGTVLQCRDMCTFHPLDFLSKFKEEHLQAANIPQHEKCFNKIVEKFRSHFMFGKFSPRVVPFMFGKFPPVCRTVYDIMWKNMVQPDRPQVTVLYGACAFHAS